MKKLSGLQKCRSIPALRRELHELCRPYGEIQRLDVLDSKHEGRRQAICFLRMDTPSQDAAVMRALGVGRFGGEIVLVVEVQEPPAQVASIERSPAPSFQWTDWQAL